MASHFPPLTHRFTRRIALTVLLVLSLAPFLAARAENGPVVWGSQHFDVRDFSQPFTQVSAGAFHTVALRSDGTLVAWGRTVLGQATVPAGVSGVTAIAAGANHTLGLKASGIVFAWGSNSDGQKAVPAGLNEVSAIAAGGAHSVALKSGGTVVAWGKNDAGQATVPAELSGVSAIGAGDRHTVALKSTGTVVAWGETADGQATVPAGLSGVSAIAVGANHTVALKKNGTVVAWGKNDFGQTTVPTGLNAVKAIAAGADFTVALKNDGSVVAWGNNSSGQTTIPSGLTMVQSVAAGSSHAVALKTDGTLEAWGSNSDGQAIVSSRLAGAKSVAAGYSHTLALKIDGTVVAWGSNNAGQSTVPADLGGVRAIAAGFKHSLAMKGDGTVVAWGATNAGQTAVPAGLSGVIAIAAGSNHSLAVKSDGTVTAWGKDDYQQSTVPPGLSDVLAVAGGERHSLALKSDGTVVAWGDNDSGQRMVPADLSGVRAIAAGLYHSVALKNDGTVVGWGQNDSGQATAPLGLTDVRAIAAGGYHTVALRGDGTVIAWGYNGNGQTDLPATLEGAKSIAAGYGHTAALLLTEPLTLALFGKGDRVPGAGKSGSGVPAGASFTSFGAPSINDTGAVAFVGTWRSPSGAGTGIFAGNPATLVTKIGASAGSSVTFASFKDPVLNAAGRVAFTATLAGNGVTTGNNTALFTNAFPGGALTLVAQKNAVVEETDGARLSTFTGLSLQGEELLYVAKLQRGSPTVTSGNNLAAYRQTATARTRVIRSSQPFGATRVKSFRLLNVVPGSAAQSRAHAEGHANFFVLLRDQSQVLVDAVPTLDASTLERIDGSFDTLSVRTESGQLTGGIELPNATFKTFGPVAAPAATSAAMTAKLTVGEGGVKTTDALGVFLQLPGAGFEPIARSGDPTGLNGVRFGTFKSPVLDPSTGTIAFPATLKGAVTTARDATLWWKTATGSLAMLAREGSTPVGTGPGVKWNIFKSLGVVGSTAVTAGTLATAGGPIFSATLLRDSGGVDASNDAGLWAVNSNGTLQLLVRKGARVEGRTLKEIGALTTVPGSAGVTRSFNNAGEVVYRATFTDDTQAVVLVLVP